MNVSKTNEQALEAAIEKRLAGTCLEGIREKGELNVLQERQELYRAGDGFYIGLPEDFNAKYALDEYRF